MTSRAKPVKSKSRRSPWDNERRQQVIVTIVFAAVIALGLLILLGAVAVSYYNTHLLAVATVGGQPISRDQWLDRVNVVTFRIDEGEARLREAVSAGELDAATEQQEVSQLESGRATVQDQALQSLIDDTYLAQVAAPMGLSVSDAEVDAQMAVDASQPEQRRVSVLTFKPSVDAVTGLPSEAQKAAAQAAAAKALGDLQAGKTLADVAGQDGADSGAAEDFGYVTAYDTSDDPNLIKAIFALPAKGYTPVVLGQDGYLRIAQVADIRPAVPDGNFLQTLQTYTTVAAYRATVKAELFQQKVAAKVTADDLASNVTQVRAWEIQLAVTTDSTTGESDAAQPKVRVSHILYAPNGDPNAGATLDPSDPAWGVAQAKAQAAADRLRAITDISARETAFAALARTDSDDTGSATAGGDLGFQTQSSFVSEFGDAIFNGSHTTGEIIGPVKSQYGYHVILWEAQEAPTVQRIKDLAAELAKPAPGVSFQSLAIAESDAPDAAQGGAMGWFAKGQASDYHIEQALFGLQPGGVSSPVELSDGYYLYMVSETAQRPPYGDQVGTIRANAFTNWYQPQKDAAGTNHTIATDPSMTSIILQGQSQ